MTQYTIGEVAARSGFSASAIRYYEQQGLIEPVGRTDAGYRLYDERSIARLGFVARAKELGCTLDEIADLAELWEADDCGPVQSRLHALVTAKVAEAQRRTAELAQLTAELQSAAARLRSEPVDGPCSDQCACQGVDAEPDHTHGVTLGGHSSPIVCTLSADRMTGRIEDWQHVLSFVRARERTPDDRLRVVFDPSVPVHDVVRLAVAEQGCCSFFAFTVTVDGRGLALEINAPDEATDLVTALFGA